MSTCFSELPFVPHLLHELMEAAPVVQLWVIRISDKCR